MTTAFQAEKVQPKRMGIRRVGTAIFDARRKVATGAIALLAVMLAYHVVFGRNGLTVYQAKRKDLRSLQEQVRTLQRDNEQLRSHVERLGTDPGAVEHEAREQLHYTRPGEVIYTLPLATTEAR